MDEREYLSMPRYVNLRELNLNCNNLDASCLDIICHMKNLRILNLMGNFINAEIPDMSKLEYLEEINLSYNHIESYFVNLNLLKDFKLHGKNIIQENENENEEGTKVNQTEESKDEDVVNTQSNIRNSKPNKKRGKDNNISISSKNNNEESKTNTIESNNNKKDNTSNFDKNNNISYNDREINAKHLSNNQQIFLTQVILIKIIIYHIMIEK